MTTPTEPTASTAAPAAAPSTTLRVRPTLPPEIEKRPPRRAPRPGPPKPKGERTIRKLRSLSTRGRWMLAAGVAFALLPALVSTLSAWHNGWIPSGDNALIGLRVSDVFTSHTPLIGQPSTSDLYGSVAANHPGPIEFWILALPYQLLGAAGGLLIGSMLINMAAIVGVAFVAFRRQGLEFALWSLLLVTALGWGLRANFFHDPVSSNVATFTVVLLIYLMWSLFLADFALMPLAAVVVSFVFQDHLSVLGQNALLAGVGVAALAFLAWRRWGQQRSQVLMWSAWSALAVAIVWAPVVYQQFTGHPGNISAIIDSYKYNSTGHSKGVVYAFDRLLTALGPRPIFLKQFAIGSTDYLHQPLGPFPRLVAILPLLALLGLGGYAFWKKRHVLVMLAAAALAALVSGFYSAVTLPEKSADLKPSAVRWMWTAGMFTWVAVGWLAWSLLVPRRTMRQYGKWLAPVLAVAVGLMGIVSTTTTSMTQERDYQYFSEVSRVMPEVRAHLRPGQPYVVSFSGIDSGLTVGPAVAMNLREHGHQVFGQTFFLRAFTEDRMYRHEGQVVGAVYVNDKGLNPPIPGAHIAAIIPNDKDQINRAMAPFLPDTEAALNRIGGYHITDKGQALMRDPASGGDPIGEAIGVSLSSRKALLYSGLLGDAIQRGYVTAPGLDPALVKNLRGRVLSTKVTPYVAVFYGPAPAPEPLKK